MKLFSKSIFITVFVCFSANTNAQTPHQKSDNTYGKFEIVQSSTLARDTYKVDKQNGRVWIFTDLMEEDKVVASGWVEIERRDYDQKPVETQQINYQYFISGIAARHTYLINLNDGLTWQVVKTKNENLVLDLVPQ